jgi:hypothetical protein
MPLAVIYIAAGLLFPVVTHDLLPYLPYGYFTVPGFVATGIFIWAFLVSFNWDGTWLPWISLLSAVIFNPVMKLPLSHEIRIMADIAAGMLLLFTLNKIKQQPVTKIF